MIIICLNSGAVFMKGQSQIIVFSWLYLYAKIKPKICPYSTRHSHSDRQYLTVPPFHSSVFKSAKHFGHSFAFDAPKIWNDLPQDVCSATSVASFRKKLKTYLFAKAYLL